MIQNRYSQSDYRNAKDRILSRIHPYSQERLASLKMRTPEVFTLGSRNLEANPEFVSDLSNLLNFSANQQRYIREADPLELPAFFNQLIACKARTLPNVIVSIDPESRALSSIRLASEGTAVSPSAIFKIAECLFDAGGYEPAEIIGDGNSIGISLYKPKSPAVELLQNEIFNIDGLYLKWDQQSVALSHYYERLICVNGMTVTEREHDASLRTQTSESLRRFIRLALSVDFLNQGIAKYREGIRQAIQAKASLREVRQLNQALIELGVSEGAAEMIFPIKKLVGLYTDAHRYEERPESQLVANESIWALYNKLTDFASHTELLARHSVKRAIIRKKAQNLLYAKRDIQTYEDIFSA